VRTSTGNGPLALALLAALALAAPADARQDIPALLDRYAAGDDGAARVVDGASPDAFVQAVERHAARWIGTGADAGARRLIAAAFALEAADSLVDTPRRILYRRLFEWGCAQVRGLPPSDPIAAWHRAAIALLLRAEDWPMLLGPDPAAGPGARQSGEAAEGHLRHARAAIPDDPRLALVEVMAEESRAVESRRPPLADAAGDPRHERMAARYAELSSDPAIAAEARLRHGVTRLRLGTTEAALDDLARAASMTDDPHVRHVAAFLTGLVHAREGRTADALAQLRRALDAAPGAGAATALAAALLLNGGQADEAAALADAVFVVPAPLDPWRLYAIGDGRLWPERIAALREAVR
jgi:tetratricopeptide (TPR) repeat protein